MSPTRSKIILTALMSVGAAGCATYSEPPAQVFYEVPCGTPGAFEAMVVPEKLAAVTEPAAGQPVEEAAEIEAGPQAVPAKDDAPQQRLCLASAGSVPRGYGGRAYRYFGNRWWPYGGGFVGVGLGFSHGTRHGVRHHGRAHHGGGRHGGSHGAGHRRGGHH